MGLTIQNSFLYSASRFEPSADFVNLKTLLVVCLLGCLLGCLLDCLLPCLAEFVCMSDLFGLVWFGWLVVWLFGCLVACLFFLSFLCLFI